MKDKAQVHKYSTHFDFSPNALSSAGTIEGALIRHNGGYGCLQPWPSLGDEDLDYHLLSIRKNNPTEQALACFRCCEIDGNARMKGIDLFENITIPEYHFTTSVPTNHKISDEFKNELKAFTHLKVKGIKDTVKVAHYLELLPENLFFRIDFNSSLNPEECFQFVQHLNQDCRNRIDFIEDPFPYDPAIWDRCTKETGINLALDRGPQDAEHGFNIRIWKPAIFPYVTNNVPVCVTHNMDHELGRRYAAYQSAITNHTVTVNGIGLFDEAKNGPGLGMCDLLENLLWDDLK